ncbi:hypothetical protein AX767_04715 [Variovorax sp. PAMC 28711]|nr:hypothetical protein AX767_04715 [Variovorax sp. PAMC 28711]
MPRSPRFLAVPLAGLLFVSAVLLGCDAKPSMPTPKAGSSEGPTAASGGPPSSAYPAGIKPAASGDTVITSATPSSGPSEGGAAVGGMSAGQSGGAPPAGGAAAPTAGDGKTSSQSQ